jgi:hypothetical protein
VGSSERSRRPDMVGVAVVLTLSAFIAWCIGLRPDGAWYSSSWAHRLQTEAFFRGTFALQPVPNGQMADWAWSNGSHQVWSLGAAFFRFPFEVLARATGSAGFPDRVTLLLAFGGVAGVLASAFRDLPWLQRTCLLVVTALSPAIVTLLRTRLAVYEEASAYACLWALLLAGLLLRLARRPSRSAFLWLCALAGLAPFFRPTLLFVAFVTLALAFAVARRLRLPAADAAIGAAIFCAGLGALGAANFLRFGSPFETGQLLNVSYIPVDQFSKVFGYPFWYEPWTSAARELVSSLCLAESWNGTDWYRTAIHPWQSPTLRFREFYFSTFTPAVLVAVVLGWLGVLAARLSGPIEDPRIAVGALWSFGVFALMFAFYLWAPSMTSRYAADFAPAVAIGLAATLLLVFREIERAAGPMWPTFVALAGIAWIAHDVAAAGISPTHADRRLVTADVVRETLPKPVMAGAPLPDGYRCGASPEDSGVKFNGSGWASTADCTVDAGSMFFLSGVDCVRVTVRSAGGGTPGDAELAPVRARAGLVELVRTRTEKTEGGASLTFCSPPGRDARAAGIEVVYLGWMEPRLVRPGSRPLRLDSIEKVTR